MKRIYTDYLQDMIDNCDQAAAFVSGITLDEFQSQRKDIYAVVRALEIIGEAARHIPDSLRDKYPAIPWSKAMGMRDRVVHGYFAVDLKSSGRRCATTFPS